MNTLKTIAMAFVVGALMLAPAGVRSARADDDDWEDRWEDYHEDLEDKREDAEERWEEWREEHGHYAPYGGYRARYYPGLRYDGYRPTYSSHYCPHVSRYYAPRYYGGEVHAGPAHVYYGRHGAVRVGPVHVYW